MADTESLRDALEAAMVAIAMALDMIEGEAGLGLPTRAQRGYNAQRGAMTDDEKRAWDRAKDRDRKRARRQKSGQNPDKNPDKIRTESGQNPDKNRPTAGPTSREAGCGGPAEIRTQSGQSGIPEIRTDRESLLPTAEERAISKIGLARCRETLGVDGALRARQEAWDPTSEEPF